MSVRDWNRSDRVDFNLMITVEDYEGEPDIDGLREDFIVIKIGSTTIWEETLDDRLYWDPHGDGGPGLDDAVIDKVGEILGGLINDVEGSRRAGHT